MGTDPARNSQTIINVIHNYRWQASVLKTTLNRRQCVYFLLSCKTTNDTEQR